MTKKSPVITMRLSPRELEQIEAVTTLEKIDRTTLLKEFIEDGLRRRITSIYSTGRLTASKAAEILDIPLRAFLEMMEEEGIPVNWDSKIIKDYLKSRYGD